MTVQTRKDEILRLISRVSSAEPGRSSSEEARTVPDPRRPPRIRPAAGRQEPGHNLEALRQRRRELEEKLLGGGVPGLLRGIEQRLAAVEARLDSLPAGATSRPQAPPDGLAPQVPTAPAALPATTGADESLAGKIAEGVLADILQMLSSNMASGLFLIRGEGCPEFTLSFAEGQIVHATGGGLSGESAFFAAMGVEHGRFAFREKAPLPPERTIGSKTQFLILEALRQIDESRAGGGGHG